MASLRKASSYSKKKVRPYTRKSKTRTKAFIKTIPQNKIVKYHTGELKLSKIYNYQVSLISKDKIQVRDNALESCRTLITKYMEKNAQGQYYFNIKVYPHHILRENKTAAGAGADRLSSGMKHSFGITIGRAAIVQPEQEIYVINCDNEKTARIAKEVLMKAKSKMPCKCIIKFSKIDKTQ